MSKLKFILAGWAIAAVAFAGIVFITNFAMDFSTYQSILESTYETPWYSQNWFKEPYTNFRLLQYPSKFHTTINGDHSQLWIVKEKTVGDKVFWTIDYRMAITESNYIVRCPVSMTLSRQ